MLENAGVLRNTQIHRASKTRSFFLFSLYTYQPVGCRRLVVMEMEMNLFAKCIPDAY
jgi:hypothetical protein